MVNNPTWVVSQNKSPSNQPQQVHLIHKKTSGKEEVLTGVLMQPSSSSTLLAKLQV
jgi:hypothetical protein